MKQRDSLLKSTEHNSPSETGGKDTKLIDGSQMEGGGQILRMSSLFSCLLRFPLKIYNIRGKRTKPGLAAQHLAGLELISEMANCDLINASLGSTWIKIVPRDTDCLVGGGQFYKDTRTAGSIGLLLQSTIPFALFGCEGAVRMRLVGGTNARFAPHIDWLKNVMFPNLRSLFSAEIECNVLRRGCFPRGGGSVDIAIVPIKSSFIKPIAQFGHVDNNTHDVIVESWECGKTSKHLAESLKKACIDSITTHIPVSHSNCSFENQSLSPGCGAII